jgi:hypothetical protein
MTNATPTNATASVAEADQFAASSAGSGKWLIARGAGANRQQHAVIFGAPDAAAAYVQRLNAHFAAKSRRSASATRANVIAG